MKAKRVLIVDDRDDNLYLLHMMLQGHGYEVDEAGNGVEALEMARSRPPDLVITDILMPVMDGFTLCREWKSDAALKTIPLVFYTATYTDERDREFGLSIGAARFIVKPEEPENFMAIINGVVQSINVDIGNSGLEHDGGTSGPDPDKFSPVPERDYLKNYNEVLVRKLEEKMLELERVNCELTQDISERKAAQEKLGKSEALLMRTQELAKVGGWEYDTVTGQMTWTADVNRIFGVQWDEISARPEDIVMLFAQEDRPALSVAFRRTIETGESYDMEVRMIAESGGYIWVRAVGNAEIREGRIVGAFGSIVDITKRKEAEEERLKLEEQLRQSQKLKAIGQLASGVAHDFNNCLGGISGYTDLLQLEIREKAPELLPYTENIHQVTAKAADLTKRLLSFARKSNFNMVSLDIHEIIREVVDMLSHTINRLIKIETCLDAAEFVIRADRTQFLNALLNLCVNARDAMPQGGTLKLKTCNRSFPERSILVKAKRAPGDYLEISVSDTGIGMSDEVRQHMFEPFYTTKEVGKGTGLGLASVYGTVKQLGGYIDLESEVGKGTEIVMQLPVSRGVAVQAPQSAESIMITGSGMILVIEDEDFMRESEVGMLTALGYSVFAVEDGRKGVEYYERYRSSIDLVICDIVLPELSGVECVRRIRELNPAARVIVASGYGDATEREQMRLAGVIGFIDKPFRMNDMSRVVADTLRRAMS